MSLELIVDTGIPKLDDMLGGGIKRGSSALILSIPGVNPQPFILQAMYYSLTKGRKCIYYVDEKFPSVVKKQMETMKLWERTYVEKAVFIDGFSWKVGIPSNERYTVTKSDPKEVILTIEKALRENRNRTLFFYEGYEGMPLTYNADKALTLLDDVISVALAQQATLIVSMVNWDFSDSFIEEVKKRFDYVITLDSVEERFLMRHYFSVEKAPTKFERLVVPYRIGIDGIGVYVPKIIVTGPFHSGKSTFIQKISTRAVSVDRMGTTVALDHGYIDHSGVGADLFGTPGQERFEFMLDILKRDAFGVILIVDSTDPATFGRALEMLKQVRKEAIPYAVAANKQDIEGALTPEEVRKQMSLPAEIPVIGTSAITGAGCLEVVKALIDLVITKKIRTK
jgi:small GTP-binding protein